MSTKLENRIGVNFAIFRSTPWRQFIELLEICCKDTNIHKSVVNKIFEFWLHKAQNVRACHIYLISSQSLNLGGRRCTIDDVATIPFHLSLSSAALMQSPNFYNKIIKGLVVNVAQHGIWGVL